MSNGELVLKSRTEQRIEAEQGHPIAFVLYDLYHQRGMTQEQMAAKLHVHRTTVVDLMKRHNVGTGYNKSGTAA